MVGLLNGNLNYNYFEFMKTNLLLYQLLQE